MHIAQLLGQKSNNLFGAPIPTIAFLGDSVTQGCFEIYVKQDGGIETVFERESAFCACVQKILAILYPRVTVNILNAGISGDNAANGSARLERDVLNHRPDLTVVSYGLNDSGAGMDGIERYRESLRNIFTRLQESGSEVIFMTSNMMNTRMPQTREPQEVMAVAQRTMQTQTSGVLSAYFDAARQVADECGVRVCDVYRKWEAMAAAGVDTTALLSNHVNHPTRELNWLAGYSLVECMLQ